MHGTSLQNYLRSFYFRETFYDQAPEMLQAVWVVVTLHIILIHILYGIAGWKHDQSTVRLHFPMTNSWVPYEIDCIRCPWFVVLLTISWIFCRWGFSLQLIIPEIYRKYFKYFPNYILVSIFNKRFKGLKIWAYCRPARSKN